MRGLITFLEGKGVEAVESIEEKMGMQLGLEELKFHDELLFFQLLLSFFLLVPFFDKLDGDGRPTDAEQGVEAVGKVLGEP